jgi:peptide/nickel transport system permease protein
MHSVGLGSATTLGARADAGGGRRLLRGLGRFLRRKPLGAAGAALLLLIVLAAVFAPLIAPYDPAENIAGARLKGPSAVHWMGTDAQARDLFSRVIYGARLSLTVGLLSVVLGTTAGAALGIISGYLGGWADLLLQRCVDVMLAVPALILAIAMVAMLGQSVTNVVVALAVAQAPRTAIVVRGMVLSIRAQPFVEAARSLGSADLRVMARHILPNVAAPLIVLLTAGLCGAIVAETSLSFLGLGAPVTTPSWGEMLSNQARRFMTVAPWLGIFPGLAITLVVLSVNLLGDALRDLLDPRLRM